VTVSRETDQPLWEVAGLAAGAALAGLRGDAERCAALAAEAEQALPPGAADGMLAMAELARGLGELAAGRPDGALASFRRVLDPDEPWHVDFVARWCVADAAEAAVQSGALPEARELVARFERAPGRGEHLEGSLAYARLLAGPADAAPAAAAAALEACAGLPALRARVQLAYGGMLRRGRRSPEARPLLRSARDTFEALGMGPPAEAARRELRAAGDAVGAAAVDAAEVLSPHELQIARMAADGLSNREIGQALFLSHRTIGSHLYRMFPKLGIAGRGELRVALGS
jgi:ATP/maltotriose-dependent transcriptional regulator MalT